MKDDNMIGQAPMTQFQSPNGEWSIFALLITACGGMIAAVLYLFRSREAESLARIGELKKENEEIKADVVELRHEANKCHEDRLLIHGQMTELKLQMARLQGS